MRNLSDDLLNAEPALRRIEAIKLSYRMWFPDDEREYDEAISTISSEALGHFQTEDPEHLVKTATATDPLLNSYFSSLDPEDERRSEFVRFVASTSLKIFTRKFFIDHGGFSSVAKATGTANLEARMTGLKPRGMFAGFALATLYRMHRHHSNIGRGGASLNKLWALIEEWRPNDIQKLSTRTMQAHWKEYRNVCHLWATCSHIEQISDRNPIEHLFEDTREFLRIARTYQAFSLDFFSNHQTDPKWNPVEDIWRIPGDECLAESSMPGLLPLPAQIRLAAYKAILDAN